MRYNIFPANRKILILILAALYIYGCSAQSQNANDDYYQPPPGYDIDELNQYGEWVRVFDYGKVWRPSVVSTWEPFSYGHWVYADNNWAWVSYEPFGWVVYHYGRWYDDDFYGWVWIPEDTGWMPANVVWYQYDDYICWAPLPPEGIRYGSPLDENNWRYWHTVSVNNFLNDNVGSYNEHGTVSLNPGGVSRQDKGRTDNSQNDAGQGRSSSGSNARNNTGGRNAITGSPTREEIENRSNRSVADTPVKREQVKTKSSNLSRMDLPDGEQKRVNQHQNDVKNQILIPKPESKKQPPKDNTNQKRN